MLQATPSPGGRFIARILATGTLQISVLPVEERLSALTLNLTLGGDLDRQFLPAVQKLSWSHESREISEHETLATGKDDIGTMRTWLLLTSKNRLVVARLDYRLECSSGSAMAEVVTDLEFSSESYGGISSSEFVSDYQSVLLLFDIAPHASLLSLAQAQRQDIPNRKFATKQGYAIRHVRQPANQTEFTSALALLCRDKHSDIVVVVDQGKVVSSFKAQTIDAQSLLWCPDESPMLALRESAAYGTKLVFVTPFGHALRSLDIGGESSIVPGLNADFPGTGISALDWVRKAGSRSVSGLALGDGNKNILFRTQDSKSLAINSCTFHHPKSLKGPKTAIWQEVGPNQYQSISGELNLEGSNVGEVEIVAVSTDCCNVASKTGDVPNVVFIWDIKYTDPVAAIYLRNDVRQLLWDPCSSKLIIMSSDTTVGFHYWTDVSTAPTMISVPQLQNFSSARWQGQWIQQFPSLKDSMSTTRESLFLVFSKSHFDVLRTDALDHGYFVSCFNDEQLSFQKSIPGFQSSAKSTDNGSDTSSIFF